MSPLRSWASDILEADYDPAMPSARTFTNGQLAFAAFVVLVFAFLTWDGKVSGDATIALASGVTGAVLSAPLAAKASQQEARAGGITEGVQAVHDAQNGHDT